MLGKTEDRRSRAREDAMIGWHDRFNGHEFEQTPGDREGQGCLVSCGPRGYKESDATELMFLLYQGCDAGYMLPCICQTDRTVHHKSEFSVSVFQINKSTDKSNSTPTSTLK